MRTSEMKKESAVSDPPGKVKADRIERFCIEYHRISKLKPGVTPEDTEWNYVTWGYDEQIVIDRRTETLIHSQNIGSGCQISRKYYVEGGISSLLDELKTSEFLETIKGNETDVVRDPLEKKNYTITVEFLYGGQKVLAGTFDRNGLPEDFPDAAETILEFMQFYNWGEILDPSVYGKTLRKQSDCIFCNVVFEEYGKTYCYLTDDDSLKEGDYVVVPVGREKHEAVVQIESIEYHPADEATFPFEKIKKVLGRYVDKQE